ncbi:MAG: hypothetical protein LBU91_07500 [Bacteroidales bacterium]|jgi:RHS repeat-associated protein|nr:hypothetical protein [Bacteroidales bacterium]
MNGDGMQDLVGFASDGVYVSLNQANDQPQLLGVKDNSKSLFTAEYEPLSNSSSYTKGITVRNFPLMNFQGPLLVCTKLTTLANQKTFAYKDAIVHQHRGFLGFEQITETDLRLGLKQVSTFELKPTYFVNLPKTTQLFALDNTPLSERTQTNTIVVLGLGRIWNKITKTTSTDRLAGVEQTTDVVYGNSTPDGNVTYTKTTLKPIGGANLSVSETTNTYTTVLSRRYPNRLETSITKNYYVARQSDGIFNKQFFDYDPKGNLIEKIDRYESNDPVTTSYERDPATGVITGTSVAADGVETQTQSFVYDARDRFQLSATTVGLGTSFQTFDAMGRLTSETAVGGQKTEYKYDKYGRLSKEISPDLIATTYSYRRASVLSQDVVFEQRAGQPSVKTYLDDLGRAVKTETPSANPDGRLVVTETEYYPNGKVKRTSMPHFSNVAPIWTSYEYSDPAGRITKETTPTGLITSYSYVGLTTTVSDNASRSSSQIHNAAGDLISTTDNGGTIQYTSYRAPGLVETIKAPGNAVTTIIYDNYGRQTSIDDPDAGLIKYEEYDAYDRIIKQADARDSVTKNKYDQFGRLEWTEDGDGKTTYSYYTKSEDSYNVGRLKQMERDGITFTYGYDRYGRTTLLNENGYQTKYEYEPSTGNLESYEYPSGFKLHYNYNDNGYQTAIWHLNSMGPFIWQLGDVDAMGQELNSTVWGKNKTQTYNASGQPTKMTLQGLMDYTYTYDDATGRMLSRKNRYNGQDETFSYDNLDRLTSGVSYDGSGNISSKTGVGTYYYDDPQHKHAVTSVTANLPAPKHKIDYNSLGKIEYITNLSDDPNTNFGIAFWYGPTGQRSGVQISNYMNMLYRDYYQNGEFTSLLPAQGNRKTLYKDYIYSPYGLVAVHYKGGNVGGVQFDELKPIATDHLGSIVAEYKVPLFSTTNGEYNYFGYDAWGRRYYYDSTLHTTSPIYGTRFYFDEYPIEMPTIEKFFDYYTRGYTGHEHVDMFGLINMNGRMYDPVLGRFLSPDPYVADGTYSQDFNRYSYARNNPLSYTDPSGEFVFLAWLLFSDRGYDFQKAISPIAFHIDLKFGSDQKGVGFDVSYGVPTLIPVSYRAHQGATYYWKFDDLMGNDLSGWETRKGGEWSILSGLYTYGGTTYNSDWSGEQTTNYHKINLGGLKLTYQNDMPPKGFFANLPGVPNGDGDRYRTASAKINFFGMWEIGTQMITGDGGFKDRDKEGNYYVDANGNKIYAPYDGYNPNSHRTGLFYFKAGPFSIGRNSEQIRHVFQNQFAHSFITGGKTKWFEVLELDKKWFWQIGGGGLW